jgi:hypothetical protein
VTLNTDVTPAQVALCMVQLKDARLVQTHDYPEHDLAIILCYSLIYDELTSD